MKRLLRRRTLDLIGLPLLAGLVLASLSACGVPLFSPDAVLAARFISSLDFKGEAVTPIPDNGDSFDPSTLRFYPSRVRPIDQYGPDGFLIGENFSGVEILVSCPSPGDPNPATSGIRALINTNDGFGIADSDPLHLKLSFDTAVSAVNSPSVYSDYYVRVSYDVNPVSLDYVAVKYPALITDSLLVLRIHGVATDLDARVLADHSGLFSSQPKPVGGSFAYSPTPGDMRLYMLCRDGTTTTYVPVGYEIASVTSQSTDPLTTDPILQTKAITIPDAPSNGVLFFDPLSLRIYFSYESGGTVKTLTWISGSAMYTEIPVHHLPKAILPDASLYVEKDGKASVYDSAGSLVGEISTGGLHFVHMAYNAGTPELVFTYAFAAPYDGRKGVYTRTYSTSLSHFLSLLK